MPDDFANRIDQYAAPPRKPGETAEAYAQRIAAMAKTTTLRMSPVKDPRMRGIMGVQNQLMNDPMTKGFDYVDVESGGKRTRIYQKDPARIPGS